MMVDFISIHLHGMFDAIQQILGYKGQGVMDTFQHKDDQPHKNFLWQDRK